MLSAASRVYPTAVQVTAPEKVNGSLSTGAGKEVMVIDAATERRILMKTDLHVMPILFLLFLVSFVDRSNLGNTKIEGIEASLGMKGNQFNIALFVFNIPYVLLDVPSNLILRKTRPGPWLASLMFCWGIATIGQGLVRNFAGLVACRVLMGIFEAGFVPGCAFLIGSYYKRHEFQLRYSFFFSAAILAGAFSGFLAFLLRKLNGVGGYEGWRWIFLIEGILTCFIAVLAYFLVVPWPKDSAFLPPDLKKMMLHRLAVDQPDRMSHGNTKALVACLKDWKIWLGILAYFGADNTASSFASFQPTIVQSLGYSPSDAQIRTIPVYMVALVFALTTAYFSDKFQHRYFFCLGGCFLSIIGWSIQLTQAGGPERPGVRYFGLFPTLAGTYMLMPVLVVWLSNNMGGSFKRGFATAIQIGCGNTANFVSANVFIDKEKPTFHTAFSVGLALQCMTGLVCTIMAAGLYYENRKRDRLVAEGKIGLEEEGEVEAKNMGDDDPRFRYTI